MPNDLQNNAKMGEVLNGINGQSHSKITMLQEATHKAKSRCCVETKNGMLHVSTECKSVEAFFDFVAGIRLREIPRDGSRWDKVLQHAELFASQVSWFSDEASKYATHCHETACSIWSSCRSLLQLGPRYISVLEKVFNLFQDCSMTLLFFLGHRELLWTKRELQNIVTLCFADLLNLVTRTHVYYVYKQPSTTFNSNDFDELFARNIVAFFARGEELATSIWSIKLGTLEMPEDTSLEDLQEFLSPNDSIVRSLSASKNFTKTRADFTCEWFDRYFQDFQRGSTELLIVTGRPGTGKSVLYDWVIERSQTLIGRRTAVTLTHAFDRDLLTELSTMSMLKNLLLQMLKLNVGDQNLYKSLVDSYKLSLNGLPSSEIENTLWSALEIGLKEQRDQTILIDGLDCIANNGEAQKALDRLQKIACKFSKTKCVVFTRPLSGLKLGHVTNFEISGQDLVQDLRHFATSLLLSISSYRSASKDDQEKMTAEFVLRGSGSFDWIEHAKGLLENAGSYDTVLKKIHTLPRTLDELIEYTVGAIDLKLKDTRSILAWMLTAQRPLSVMEIKRLLEIDSAKVMEVPLENQSVDSIIQPCKSILVIRDGFLRFRSANTKQVLYDKALSVTDFRNKGAFPFHIKEAHYDFTLRLLAYAKVHLASPSKPTISPLGRYELTQCFKSQDLLQYAARYWAYHFQSSPMHEPVVAHKTTPAFKAVFPSTTYLAIIEGSVYRQQYDAKHATDYHLLTFALRKAILGETSDAALQCVLNLAVLRNATSTAEGVNDYWYQAWKITMKTSNKMLAQLCAQKYVDFTSNMVCKEKTEVFMHRSELLEYLIVTLRADRASNRQILVHINTIITMYTQTGEIERAIHYQRLSYKLNVETFGRSSTEARRSRELLVSTMQKSGVKEDLADDLEVRYEDARRTMSILDQNRWTLSWSMIKHYESQRNTFRLEEVLIDMWQSLIRLKSKEIIIKEKRLDVAIHYVEFLKNHDRNIEAELVLKAIWSDIMRTEIRSDAIIRRSRQLGELFQSLGSSLSSKIIYTKVLAWYEEAGKGDSSDAVTLRQALEEMFQAQLTEDDISGIDTSMDIALLQKDVDIQFHSTNARVISCYSVTAAATLTEIYYNESRWSEIVRTGTLTLQRLWPGFTDKDKDTSLPTTHSTETLTIARRLAHSFMKLGKVQEAERCYTRIFQATRSLESTSDESLDACFESVVGFYRRYNMTEKLCMTYKNMALEIEKRHGKTHKRTIERLYAMGDESVRLRNTTMAEFGYHRIWHNLGTEVCHQNAHRAAIALCDIYENNHQLTEALPVYASLWAMFIKHGKEYNITPSSAEALYSKYSQVLKTESKSGYATMKQLAIDYRKALVRFYGVSQELTIKATMMLAAMLEENEDHYDEAISMYEEAYQKTRDLPQGQISESILRSIDNIQSRVAVLYFNSKSIYSAKALSLYEVQLRHNQEKLGHAHRDTLRWLSVVVAARSSPSHSAGGETIQSTLQKYAMIIIKDEKNLQRLDDAGFSLSQIYMENNLQTHAEKLAIELRKQIVFGTSELNKILNLSSGAVLDRRAWTFLVSFQTNLRHERSQYSDMMSELMSEVFLYTTYTQNVARNAPSLDIIFSGVRVLKYMEHIQHSAGYDVVQKQLMTRIGSCLKNGTPIDNKALLAMLAAITRSLDSSDRDMLVMQGVNQSAKDYHEQSQFVALYDLVRLVDGYQRVVGGYSNLHKIGMALELPLLIHECGTSKTGDTKLHENMLKLSKSITKDIVSTVKSSDINVTDISLDQLNQVSILLGEQQNLEDLEWLLDTLWQARHTSTSWTSSMVVNLGRLLAETKFTRGKHSDAIKLCEDLCYNLRRVWGAHDTTTLDMHDLLSSFYTAIHDYRGAMHVQEDILRSTVSDKGEELPVLEACSIACHHLELLKRAYQRNGGWDKDAQVYIDLYQRVTQVYGGESAWKTRASQMQSIEKWQPKGADI